MSSMWLLACLACVLAPSWAASGADVLSEELQMHILPDGKLLSQFQFNVTTHSSLRHNHFTLFPKSVAHAMTRHGVEELHVSLTSGGRWLYSSWGAPPSPSPHGAELWAWMSEPEDHDEEEFYALQDTLGGMLCASLRQIGQQYTSSPQLAMRPRGTAFSSDQPLQLHYGTLPRENVCTENLTPWLKLWPCRRESGLARLLQSLKVFDSHHQSLQMHVTPSCAATSCTQRQWTLSLRLSLVMDPFDATRSTPGWSLSSQFGVDSVSRCPLTDSSTVSLHVDKAVAAAAFPDWLLQVDNDGDGDGDGELSVDPAADSVVSDGVGRGCGSQEGVRLAYDMTRRTELQLSVGWQGKWVLSRANAVSPCIVSQRFLTSSSGQFGAVHLVLRNDHPSVSRRISYFEALPWWMKVYYHTLQVRLDQRTLDPFTDFEWFQVHPAEHQGHPSTMEFLVELPPGAELRLVVQFEAVFLTITQFPPDYNRGFDIPSGVITVHTVHNSHTLYTQSLVLVLPYPDMSMPFNVIAFSSTVLAFFFGTMFNIMYRSLDEMKTKKRFQLLRLLLGMVKKLLTKLKLIRNDNDEAEEEEEQEEDDEREGEEECSRDDESDDIHAKHE